MFEEKRINNGCAKGVGDGGWDALPIYLTSASDSSIIMMRVTYSKHVKFFSASLRCLLNSGDGGLIVV